MNDRRSKGRALIVSQGPANGTSARLFDDLHHFLSERKTCRRVRVSSVETSLPKRGLDVLGQSIRAVKDVLWSSCVFFHVSIIDAMPLYLLALILGKKTIVFYWDVYPTTVYGVAYKPSRLRAVLDRLEQRLIRASDVVVVPSEDFSDSVSHRGLRIVPLWPRSGAVAASGPSELLNGPIRLAFAGQVNNTRGLTEWLADAEARLTEPTELHLYTSDDLPAGLTPSPTSPVKIFHHGYRNPDQLRADLRTMHFGLISLSPGLDQPGFPSKVFEYVENGLPTLYYGRDLPSFQQLLRDSGVGAEILPKAAWPDLRRLHQQISRNFSDSQEKFRQTTSLKWCDFDQIC